jgi:hypothetical protein
MTYDGFDQGLIYLFASAIIIARDELLICLGWNTLQYAIFMYGIMRSNKNRNSMHQQQHASFRAESEFYGSLKHEGQF